MSYVVFPLKGQNNTFEVHCGSESSVTKPSAFSRPSNLYTLGGARYMRCEFSVRVAVLDNLDVYVGINGGKICSNKTPHGGVKGWPKAFLAASVNWFALSPFRGDPDKFKLHTSKRSVSFKFDNPGDISVSSDSSLEGFGVSVFYSNFGILCTTGTSSRSLSKRFTPGHVPGYTNDDLKFPKAEQVKYDEEHTGKDLKSLGYEYIGSLKDAKSNYIYVGGLCLFNSDKPKGEKQIVAAKIKIPKLLKALKYFPAATCYEDNGTVKWHSCQRPGGYCQVYSSLGWSDRKNKENDSKESTVFLYDSSTAKFSTISPWIHKV